MIRGFLSQLFLSTLHPSNHFKCLDKVVIITCICMFASKQCGVFTMQSVVCLSLHFWCTGSIDTWLWMQAAAWLNLRCIWIKQTGTASINLHVEIKASHTWKAGSPWFPLVLGLVAMGVEGAIGRGKAQSDRQEDSVIFPCTLPNHAQFILNLNMLVLFHKFSSKVILFYTTCCLFNHCNYVRIC